MIRGIEHVGLMARNTESLAEWYGKVLHLREVFRSAEDPPIIFLAGESGSFIEIFPLKTGVTPPTPAQRQVLHLAVASDDFDSDLQGLKQAGVEPAGEPFEIFKGGRVVFFQDPEGNWLHLIHRPESWE